jgi:DNA-binding transcriptional MerR regulator
VEEEKCKFRNAKVYADQGNRCFTNKEILYIGLLGLMQDIGVPLKFMEELCSIQRCDYQMRSHHHYLLSEAHCHQTFFPTILHETAVISQVLLTIVFTQSLSTMLRP